MDNIGEFFSSMTIWNWMTLVAFLILPFTALNAFLSLRTRFKDWRATQNKSTFEKRLKQLENLVVEVGLYRKEPNSFYFIALRHIIASILMFLIAFFSFFIAFLASLSPINKPVFAFALVVFNCIPALGFAFYIMNKFFRIATYVACPNRLSKEVVNFIKSGIDKKLIPEEKGEDIIEALYNHNLITVGESEDLERIIRKILTG